MASINDSSDSRFLLPISISYYGRSFIRGLLHRAARLLMFQVYSK